MSRKILISCFLLIIYCWIAWAQMPTRIGVQNNNIRYTDAYFDSVYVNGATVAGTSGLLSQSDVDDSAAAAIARDTSKLTASAWAESLFSRLGKEWLVPLPDYPDTTLYGSVLLSDSTVTKPQFDIDGLKGMKKFLLCYGNLSTAPDSTAWGSIFYPQDDNPDSIKTWFAMSDSANSSLFIEVYNPDGTLLFTSGRITAGTTARLYTSAFTNFATIDEYALVYRMVVLNSGDAIKVGPTYFKRL